LRADALGAFGREDARTPVLDRLAREGVRAYAFAPIPLTTPSHATLVTGLHPASHGVRKNGQVLRARFETLAETLRARGFLCGAAVSGAPLHPYFGLEQGFDEFDAEAIEGDGRRADAATEAALAVADRLLTRKGAAPIFLWVHYFDPHSAYAPPEPFDLLWDAAPGPWDGSHETHNRVLYEGLPASPELLARNRNLYQGEVAYTDRAIGRLLEGLSARGLGGALVAVTADHGESFAPEYPFDHADRLTDAILRVPLIVRGGGLPTARFVDGAVPLEDVFPTLLELLGIEPPRGIDGRSRAAEFAGSEPVRDPPIFAESPRVRPRPEQRQSGRNRGALRAVQRAGCKLVFNLDTGEEQLVDLRQGSDATPDGIEAAPSERCDRDALRALHDAWARAHPLALEQRAGGSSAPLPEDLREQLMALGYTVE
jgi:arylsulfatase A-like enzyme